MAAPPRPGESGHDDKGDGTRNEQQSTPIVIVPRQTRESILQRQQIREALHDSKARTIRGPRR